MPTPAEIIQIAARSFSDPRTVKAYLEGRSVVSTKKAAIEAALRELNLAGFIRERASA